MEIYWAAPKVLRTGFDLGWWLEKQMVATTALSLEIGEVALMA